ncbi:MAG: DUF2087 domain-containing protein [Acidimicrobiales bacterium]
MTDNSDARDEPARPEVKPSRRSRPSAPEGSTDRGTRNARRSGPGGEALAAKPPPSRRRATTRLPSGAGASSDARDAAAIVGLLADDARRRVVAALILGSTTVADARAAAGLSEREAAVAVAKLVDGGLVTARSDGALDLRTEVFEEAARAASAGRPGAEPTGEVLDDAARVLRSFLRGGLLTSIPTQRSKRLIVLDRLSQEFEPGQRYPEAVVNEMLRQFHPDVASLRRYLVDEGFLDREAGQYWRAGGTFEA